MSDVFVARVAYTLPAAWPETEAQPGGDGQSGTSREDLFDVMIL